LFFGPIWTSGVQLRCCFSVCCDLLLRASGALPPSICPLHRPHTPEPRPGLLKQTIVDGRSCPGLRLARTSLRKQQGATFASWAQHGWYRRMQPTHQRALRRPSSSCPPVRGRILPSLPWCRSSDWASSCSRSAVKSAYRKALQMLCCARQQLPTWPASAS
jgi:hypothetical protein